MASDARTIAYLVDQAGGPEVVTARPMFGEHALYVANKLVALACDDQLFVKPTPGGRAHAGAVEEAPPYPGAKPCPLIAADRWDDADWLAELLRTTAAELPPPKPRKGRATTTSSRT